jgi:hypothetical protein
VTLNNLDRHVSEIALGELAKLRATAAHSDRELASAREALRTTEAELAAYLEGVAAAGLLPGEYAEGARTRKQRVERAREELGALLGRHPRVVSGDPVSAWGRMDADQRNRLLRSLIDCVLVAPVGRGRRVSIADRSRVIAHGARLVEPYRGGGVPMPIRQVPLPDADDPVVLGV